MKWAQLNQTNWEKFWSNDAIAYYVHGKDNIPFHSLILPAILLGTGNLHLPDRIISSEYLTLEGKKFSTSNHWAVWVPYVLEHYNPDSLRYFLIINGPENKDTDFSWREFIYSHNSELLGAFGNFVNRNLMFLAKLFDNAVPDSQIDGVIKEKILALYEHVGQLIEAGKLKLALESIFAFIRSSNKFFDERKPWAQFSENPPACSATLYTYVQIIANLSNLLTPFLPFTFAKIRAFLAIPQPVWKYIEVSPKQPLQPPKVLFERIDISRIKEEEDRLREP